MINHANASFNLPAPAGVSLYFIFSICRAAVFLYTFACPFHCAPLMHILEDFNYTGVPIPKLRDYLPSSLTEFSRAP